MKKPTKPKPKIISAEMHLQAFALANMAIQHYAMCRQFERRMADLLKADDDFYVGHISDAIYTDESSISIRNFDAAMAREGYVVKAAKKKTRQ